MKKLKHLAEAGALGILFVFFRLLPLDAASATGGFLGRIIGPFLSAHRTAADNLSRVMPALSAAEKRIILRDMWDNLGRNAAELPHLPGDTLFSRMTIQGIEKLPPAGQAVVFFSGHFGNWELTYPI